MLTRFAPSPTGFLHIGNMRTALICWLYARKVGGRFMLRIDDTDTERSEEKYVDAIKEDLIWLGLEWDVFARQSERMESYQKAIEELKASGRLYPCFETQQELETKRKFQMSRGQPPIYDREALKLNTEQIKAFEDEGKKPHYRFRLEEKPIEWEDEIRGKVSFDGGKLSDPILIRENGLFTYMLPSTVDDIEFEITHVVRGEDHVSNTAIQIQLFEALGAKAPLFAHNALIKSKDGKLSKRTGANSAMALREEGLAPMALASFLARIGTSDPVEVQNSMQELVDNFSIKKFSRSPTKYDEEDLFRLNSKLLHQLAYEDVKDDLPEGVDESFWNAVRQNIDSLAEVKIWQKICKESLEPVMEDKEFTRAASAHLPEGKWTEETWNEWMGKVKEATGRKGKDLFMPVRKALTGMEHGPELKVLLPLIGREKAEKRLNGEVA